MKFNRSGRIPFSTSKRGRETEVAKRNRGGIEEVPDRNFKFLASPPSFGVWLHCAHQRESKHQEERCPLREGGGPRVYLRVFTWRDPVTPTPLSPFPLLARPGRKWRGYDGKTQDKREKRPH